MPVRGTANYVWFTEPELGKGATGSVFKGRHKRQGTFCAVKVFNVTTQQRHIDVISRELELSQRIEHRNIVKFFAIEPETKNADNKVLIMELCSEGSVYDMLLIPEYTYGFPEDLYLQFVFDLSSGLEYLRQHAIVHRDIKPHNVLCNKEHDGRYVFKLTDFGSARILPENENFQSIYGTPEYLHPDVYGIALAGKSWIRPETGERVEFTSAVDIWSAAATLYHVATGRLPFKPFAGRDDKETMYDIIHKKESGFISGIQRKANGPIEYSSALPSVCRISQGLRNILEPLLARMLEQEAHKQCNFREFFETVENLKLRSPLHIYCIGSLKSHRCYLKPTDTVHHALAQLPPIVLNPGEDSTANPSVPPTPLQTVERKNVLWFYRGRPLSDWISSMDMPLTPNIPTSWDEPLLLWCDLEVLRIFVQFPDKPEQPDTEGAMNLKKDYEWSRGVCGLMYYLRAAQIDAVRSQVYVNEVIVSICAQMLKRFTVSMERFTATNISLSAAQSCYRHLVQAASNAAAINTAVQSFKTSSSRSRGRQASGDSAGPRVVPVVDAAALSSVKQELESLLRFREHIDPVLRNYEKNHVPLLKKRKNSPGIVECVTQKCTLKMNSHIDKVRENVNKFYEQMTADNLTYNEQQIHKYDRIKIEEWLNKGIIMFNEHCLKGTEKSFQSAIDWFSDHFVTWEKQMKHLEKDTENFEHNVRMFASKLSQTIADIASSYERYLPPVESGSGKYPGDRFVQEAREDSIKERSDEEAEFSTPPGSPRSRSSPVRLAPSEEAKYQQVVLLVADYNGKILSDLQKIQADTKRILEQLF